MTDLLTRVFIKNRENTEDPTVRSQYGTLSSVVGIAVNLLLSLFKILVGLLTASVATLADGFNNLSDAGSSVVSLVSFRISSKPADREHPFGHARIEYVASMIVSFLILLVGVELMTESFSALIEGNEGAVRVSLFSVIVLSVSILLKLWLALFNGKLGKRINSGVMKATAIDSLCDSISTLAVLICSIIIYFTDWYIIDAIVGIGVSVLILVAGIRVLIETKNSILGEAPVEETVEGIREIVGRYPEALGIHDLLVHNYGPSNTVASLHVEVDGAKNIYELHDVIDTIERALSEELGIFATIHMDPIVTDDETVTELLEFTKKTVNEIDPTLSIHDFRCVIGHTHTNLIFDVLLPFESLDTPDTITKKIGDAILEKRENHYCVITVDRG